MSKSKSKRTDEELKLKESLKEKIGYILTYKDNLHNLKYLLENEKLNLIHRHENENLTLEKKLQDEVLDLKHRQDLRLLAFKQTHRIEEEALRSENSYYITKRGTQLPYITDRGKILGKDKDEIKIYKTLKKKLEEQLTNGKNLQNTNNETKRKNLQKKHKYEMDQIMDQMDQIEQNQIDEIELLSKLSKNMDNDELLLSLEEPINQLYSRILFSQVDTFVLTGRVGGSTRQKKRILKAPTKGKAVKAKAKKPVRSVNKATK